MHTVTCLITVPSAHCGMSQHLVHTVTCLITAASAHCGVSITAPSAHCDMAHYYDIDCTLSHITVNGKLLWFGLNQTGSTAIQKAVVVVDAQNM